MAVLDTCAVVPTFECVEGLERFPPYIKQARLNCCL